MEPASSNHITKRDCVLVVNPKGANGRTGREWKKIYPSLSAELSKHWNVREVFTSGPSHATAIVKKAVHDGAAAVVAVGGDGTLHEVVNGFFENGKLVGPKEIGGTSRTALGLIPLGTGSDFARTFGWKTDPYQAIERLARGKQQKIDVGQLVVGDGHVQRSFINVADVHLSARAGYYAGKYKWLGNFCYIVGALQGFMHHTNCDLDIRINGGEWRRFFKVTSIAVGNAKYFGGGMKIAPTADPISRDLEVIILQDFKWYHFLLHLCKLYTGSHTTLKNVCRERVQSIEIKESVANSGNVKHDDIFVQADGEHLGFLPVSFAILPATLNLIS